MSTTKNAILSAVAKSTGSDKDDVRLHIDLFLAEVGRVLTRDRAVNIKHFGILSASVGGPITFAPSPTLIREVTGQSLMEAVITGIGEDVAEGLQQRFQPQAQPAQP